MRIHIFNEEINYVYEDTSKPKVLFLHGFASSHKFALDLLKVGEAQFDYVALDFPGCGLSTAHHDIDINYYVAVAKEFIKQLHLEDAILVGHSLGGAIATELMNAGYGKFALLVAPFNYAIYQDKLEKARTIQEWLLPETFEQAFESMKHLIYNDVTKTYVANLGPTATNFLKTMLVKRNLFKHLVINEIANPEYLKNVLQPNYDKLNPDYVFLACGENDYFVPPQSMQQMCHDLGLKYQLIPNCGHATFFEQPKVLLDLVNEIVVKQKK
ncbi:alpha/beta fold hydrolase [Candidatus Mycoplasma pogonae]